MGKKVFHAWLVVGLAALGFAEDPREREYFTPALAPKHKADKPKVSGWAASRVEEKLDRGVVAVGMPDGGVYVGWRLLQSDPADVAFHVYRAVGNGEGVRLDNEPVNTTTDFVDKEVGRLVSAGVECTYWVRPVVSGKEGGASEKARVKIGDAAGSGTVPYATVKFQGDYAVQRMAVADLNGDGRYDFVIKQPSQGIDPAGGPNTTGLTYKLEAYLSDGTFLWRKDLGPGIEPGIWYSPFVVYDFDGDGKAEVVAKTGPEDSRERDGRVRSGPEWCSIFDGMTGDEITRTDWPPRDPRLGDYNRINRNQMGIAYLDGRTPCLLLARGTYKLMVVDAYQYHNRKLERLWHWDGDEETPVIRSQGAHSMHAADVDGDGRDEVVLGSGVIDDNGEGLWCTGLGHPDHVYIGDLDPERPGMEIYYGLERGQKAGNGMCMVDGATGKILWGIKKPTRHVHGQGLVADIDARYPGCETYSADTDVNKNYAWSLLHDCKGNVISEANLWGFNPRAAYWDGDTQRTLVGGRRGGQLPNDPKLSLKPPVRVEGEIVGVADILGDWREEIVTTLPGEMRIYMTSIPAKDRRVCLMQDPFYRADISTASQGYYQIPTPKVLPGFEK
ncbi:MAG: silent information regulator protein Sir2 [Candidatus Sumerlaeia bacterium]|nr:silent information regulator protein Sir2 [Candidatus Sumerlaeia bacterium]